MGYSYKLNKWKLFDLHLRSVCRSNRKIPMADPATICILALISRVSSSRTVALRLSTLAVLNGKKGFRSTG